MGLTGFVLAAAFATCLVGAAAASAADQIYWGTGGAVRFGPLSGGTGMDLFSDSNFPTGEAIDAAAGKIYYDHNDANTITVGNLDGSGTPTDLFTAENQPLGNMGIDVAAGKLYWTDYGSGLVRVGNLDGTGTPQTLFSSEDGAIGVAIDPASGKMYWADYSSGLIREGNLNGTGTPQTLFSGESEAYGVAIDIAAGKIYWAVQTGQVRVGNLDGSGTAQTLFDSEGDPTGLALDPSAGKVYWADQLAAGTVRVGSLGGTGAQTLFSGESDPVSPVVLRAPVGGGAPTISGASAPGSTVTCSQGSWAPDLVGAYLYRAPRSFSYSWQLNGNPVSGTTNTITASSPGSYACIVTATNQAGSANQTSAPFTVGTGCQDQAGAYNQGFKAGFNAGFRKGFNAGYRVGFQRGFGSHAIAATPTYPACNAQFNQGFDTAFDKGFKRGFKSGFKPGFNRGFKAKHRRHG